MNRETAPVYLRNKYAKDLAEHSDGLARGQAQFETISGWIRLNDERVTQAEDRKRKRRLKIIAQPLALMTNLQRRRRPRHVQNGAPQRH